MKFVFLIFTLALMNQTKAFTLLCWASMEYSVDGATGVPLRADSRFCEAYLVAGQTVKISQYSRDCSYINAALYINGALQGSPIILSKNQLGYLEAKTNGIFKIHVSHRCQGLVYNAYGNFDLEI